MFNLVKSFITYLLLFTAINAYAKGSGYNSLLASLKNGNMPVIAVDLEKCALQGEGRASKMTGFARPQEFLVDAYNRLVYFSVSHFSYRGDAAPTQEYIKYKLYDDNLVNVSIFSFTLPDYQAKKVSEYICQIGAGIELIPSSTKQEKLYAN